MKRATDRASSTYERIYAVVRRIPRGRVATYGQVAKLAGLPGRARQVGYALHALRSATAVPWQRVINANGGVSLPAMSGGLTQVMLLQKEGIEFSAGDRVSLTRYQWRPRA